MFDNIFGNNTAQNNVNQTPTAPPGVSGTDMFSPPSADPIAQVPPAPQQTPSVNEPQVPPIVPPPTTPLVVPLTPQEIPQPSSFPQAASTLDIPVSTTASQAVEQTAPIQQEEVPVIPFDEEYKNKIGLQLTEAMLKGIDEGNMTESEMGVISGYILDNIDNVHTHAELNVFLQYLAQRWKVFKQVLKVEKGVERASGDSARAEEIAGLIKENKIDDALVAAQNATGGAT